MSLYNTTFRLLIYRSWNFVLQKVQENKQSETNKKYLEKATTHREKALLLLFIVVLFVFCVWYLCLFVCLVVDGNQNKPMVQIRSPATITMLRFETIF